MTVRVLAFVEGATEERFLKTCVAPVLLNTSGIYLSITTPGRKRTEGGVRPWLRIRRDLIRYLKGDAGRIVTTMFDFYGMPTDWPGRPEANGMEHAQKASTVENAMAHDIAAEIGASQRFIPYVQMHEFEALLFASPEILGRVLPPEVDIARQLQDVANVFRSPEEINDSTTTAPSKRILNLFGGYQKVLHGSIAAGEIGLSLMRQKCPHFNEWLTRLESLGP